MAEAKEKKKKERDFKTFLAFGAIVGGIITVLLLTMAISGVTESHEPINKLVRVNSTACAEVAGLGLERGDYVVTVDTGAVAGYMLESYATVNGKPANFSGPESSGTENNRVYVGTTKSVKLCWNLHDAAVDSVLGSSPQPVHLSFRPA